ncbi:Phosphoribosylformylglycinamidine cyclo-ligase [Acaryochloris thomasi RCC1774]|uniref:Phosphoribosylformylglycinamidine cyclo-ligase n=1 Tax=Acaryochloris thomasi RCC1774 TaxID=1764569 RepID=A0A2W1JLH4_9CYAN|nr:phosphoribosylformylglycinamidine cyclo-ligase [Acaryochloris thomasi]PZD74208.1 Phosphoribosylformylglycinamidine cyclo-ligase [Acaryochloris thomasi RCC1774]
MDYREAGVDVQAGRTFVNNIKDLVAQTARPEVLGGLGGFNGLFQLPTGYQEPVLVAGTDGVGTKLKLAQALNQHDTVGIDLVAMCVNDVLTCGAEPLFFLDYAATSHLEPDQLTQVVAGISAGCQQAGCALLGGETAEMPGFYQPQEYDLAGFCVGLVEKAKILDGSQVQVGDVVVGLASQGVHSNGFSLVRKIVADGGFGWNDRPELLTKSLGEMLLTPTQIYVEPVLEALRSGFAIHSMAHITGGGLPENLPRCLQKNQAAHLDPGTWTVPPIFTWLSTAGHVSREAMFDTFNMGIGYVLVVSADMAPELVTWFEQYGIWAGAIGSVTEGTQTITGL